jgi:hypothetical protein
MKKTICFAVFFLFCAGMLCAVDIKFHSKARYDTETVFLQKLGGDIIQAKLTTLGKPVDLSKLIHSKAEIIDCPKVINEMVWNEFKISRNPTCKLMDFSHFNITKCIIVEYREMNIYIVQFAVRIDITNTERYRPFEEKIIWIGKEDKIDRQTSRIDFLVSDSRHSQSGMVSYKLEAIADIDGDKIHEIIISSTGLEDKLFTLYRYRQGEINTEEARAAVSD